jgi:hypothetical protein
MATQTLTTRPVVDDSVPTGSDFVGGAAALPVRPAGSGQVVPGSDFAGGAVPLTAEAQWSEPEDGQAA